MRFHIFVSGLAILAMGIGAMSLLDKENAQGFLSGTVQLGGAIVICGIFAIKMPWHGIVGAGVMALLGASRGIVNLPGLAKFIMGDRSRGPMPLLELGITLICGLLMIRVVRVLQRERLRRMLEEE